MSIGTSKFKKNASVVLKNVQKMGRKGEHGKAPKSYKNQNGHTNVDKTANCNFNECLWGRLSFIDIVLVFINIFAAVYYDLVYRCGRYIVYSFYIHSNLHL
jgi:hypothetical protein